MAQTKSNSIFKNQNTDADNGKFQMSRTLPRVIFRTHELQDYYHSLAEKQSSCVEVNSKHLSQL